MSSEWNITPSQMSVNTLNPIRAVVDKVRLLSLTNYGPHESRFCNPVFSLHHPISLSAPLLSYTPRLLRCYTQIKRPENHKNALIDLALGDPSVFGNLPPAPEVTAAVADAAAAGNANGYTNSLGLPSTRAAVAAYESSEATKYTADDVIVTCGASQVRLNFK